MVFRTADTSLGEELLSAGAHRRLWPAGRAKINDWSSKPAAEMHVPDTT